VESVSPHHYCSYQVVVVVAELLEQRPMVVAVVVASLVELETVVLVEAERVVVDGIVAVAEASRELVAETQRWWVLDSWFPQV
jgi:hypothetical protein